jgi:hypothetical protein
MYLIVVVILVEKNRSLKTTYGSFSTITDAGGDRPSKAEPMAFAPGSVPASGDQIESATTPSKNDTDIPVTFDSLHLNRGARE